MSDHCLVLFLVSYIWCSYCNVVLSVFLRFVKFLQYIDCLQCLFHQHLDQSGYLYRWCMDSKNSVKWKKPLLDTMEHIQKLKHALESNLMFGHQGTFLVMTVYRETANVLDQTTKKLWIKERSQEECQNDKCTRIRKSIKNGKTTKKWVICSSCLVTGYCCRKCAKRDWKYGCHKVYCKSYLNSGKMTLIISQKISRMFL